MILGALFYIYVVPPLVAWWEANWYWVVAGFVVAAGLVGFWFFRWLTQPSYIGRSANSAGESDSSEQDRLLSESGITRRYLSEQETVDAPLSFFNSVVRAIRAFEPLRKYQNEFDYQINLAGYLQAQFPTMRIESQRGHSRPDISIDSIAIEIKGPTHHKALKTVPDKIMRYLQHFPGGIIVVLFDLNVEAGLYDEWYQGLKSAWPGVVVICID